MTPNELNPYENIDAEISVLGAAMQDAKAASLVVEMPKDEFVEPKHRVIHSAICEMVAQHTAIDLVTLDAQLRKANRTELVGGSAYLMSLITHVPTAANVKHYIELVHQCAVRRKLHDIGKKLMDDSADLMADVDDIREGAAIAIRNVHVGNCDRIISQQEACMSTFEEMEQRQISETTPCKQGISTGISSLDAALGRIEGSKMIVVAARPSVGKSILALTMSVASTKLHKRVLFISLETDEKEITERIFANEGNVPLGNITRGTLTDENWQDLGMCIDEVANYPLFYCLEANTVERIRKVAFSIYEDGGLDLIAVDYIQLLDATYAKRQNRQEQVAEISRGLKKLSQEMKIPIIVLSQLNRSSVNGTSQGQKVRRAPTMSEARDSGAIEQDANIFMLLHDPGIDEMKSEEEKRTWKSLKDKRLTMIKLIIDKNRQGKRGVLTVAFDGDHMRFLPISKQQPPPTETEEDDE